MKYIFSLFILYAFIQCKSKQNNDFKVVQGIVMDESGLLPGAQILVKRTQKVTQADFDAKFKIQAAKGDTLIISYTGLKTKEITIKSKNYYKITLRPQTKLSRKTKRYYRRYARKHKGMIPEF